MSKHRWNWWTSAVLPRPTNLPARRSLDLLRLEDRTAPAVVTTLTNGLLDVSLDATTDTATVSSTGGTVTVTGGATPVSFAASAVQNVSAHGDDDRTQSVTFTGSFALSGNFTVTGIDQVSLSTATVTGGTLSVTADGPITVAGSTLTGTGAVTLASAVTADSAGVPILGATPTATAGVTLADATVSGSSVTITATAAVTTDAAGDTTEDINRDFARVAAAATAAVGVGGTSKISAPGAVTIAATTTATTTSAALAKATGNDPARDAAVAVSKLTTAATVDLTGTADIAAGGKLTVSATNTATATTTADGSAGGTAAKGGSAARTVVDAVTRAAVQGAVRLAGSDIGVAATSTSNLTTTAKSTSGGATANDADTTQQLNDGGAQTADGKVGIAAAFASNVFTRHDTSATVATSGTVAATGDVSISSTTTADATATADGSVTGGSGTDTPVGVGVGVAINRGPVVSKATVGGTGTVSGKTVTVSSLLPASSDFAAKATAGAGAANVGVAGAFALDAVGTTSEAIVPAGSNVTLGGADLTLNATNNATGVADACPAGVATGSKLGIGASVALHTGDRTTRSEVESAAVTGADDLTVTATTANTATVSVTTGAEGGVAVTPGVAIAGGKNTTTARLAGGATTTTTGAVTVSATHTGTTTAKANAAAAGSKVAVGAALGIVTALDETTATVARNLTAGGAVTIAATTTATNKADGIGGANGSSSTGTADDRVNRQSGAARPPAETSAGKLGAAAALGVNVSTARATALLGSTLTAGGVVIVDAKTTDTATAGGDGSATVPGSVGVGIGLAINSATAGTVARLDPAAKVNAAGLTVHAGTGTGHTFAATAIAGAGAKKVGVAGALAIDKVTNDTRATLQPGATATTPGTAIVAADSKATTTTTATSKGTGSTLGFGATVAIAAPATTTQAEVMDGSRLSAGTLTVSAAATPTATTRVNGGSEAVNDAGTAAITPFVATTVATTTTIARVGSGLSGANTATGAVSIDATHAPVTNTFADGSAEADKVGVGVGVALTIATDTVSASARSITAGGAVTVRSGGTPAATAAVAASARGGPTQTGTMTDTTVEQEKQKGDAVAGTTTPAAPPAKAPTGGTTDGDVGVAFAAAVGVTIARTTSTATIEDGGSITAGGQLSVLAGQTTAASAKADSAPVSGITPPTAGVGAAGAAAINAVTRTTAAAVGMATVSARGLAVLTDTTSTTSAVSNAGVGAKTAAVAGSFALDTVTAPTDAVVKAGANVTVGSGAATDDLTIAATAFNFDSSSATATIPAAKQTVNAKVGVGGSFAATSVTGGLRALVGDGVPISGANDVTITAGQPVASFTRSATADAGSVSGSVAINPAVALIVADGDTGAGTGTGAPLVITGNFSATSTHIGTSTLNATADAAGKSAAVGTPVAILVADDDATSRLGRSLTATGGVTVSSVVDSDSEIDANGSAAGGSSTTDGDTLADRIKGYGTQLVSSVTAGTGSIRERIRAKIDEGRAKAKDNANADAEGVGVAGAVAVAVTKVGSLAAVDNSVVVSAGGAVTVQATGDANADTESRGAAFDTVIANAVGMSVAVNVTDLIVAARVGAGANVSGAGITVAAGPLVNDAREVVTTSLGGGGAQRNGIAGAAAVAIVTDTITADVGAGAVISSSKTLTVTADANSKLKTLAGSGAAGLANVGVGSAVAVNVVNATTTATVGANAKTDAAGATLVRATAATAGVDGDIPTDPVAGAAGGSLSANFGLAGSVAVNVVNETVRATVGTGAKVNATGAVGSAAQTVEVRATTDNKLNSAAGVASVSTAGGQFGPGADVTVFHRDTTAEIGSGASVRSGGAVTVTAVATEKVASVAASIGGSATAQVVGAVSAYVPTTTTRAAVQGSASVDATGNVTVSAAHTTTATTVVGSGAAGKYAAVGGAFSVVVIDATVDAFVGPSATVITRGVTGLTVEAKQTSDITPVAAGGVLGGKAGVVGSASVAQVTETVTAHLDAGVTVMAANAAVGIDPSVRVIATDSTKLVGVAGGLAISQTAGIGAGADAHRVEKDTQAWIAANTVVTADRDVTVNANSVTDVTSVSGSAGGGESAGVVGAAGVVVIDAVTQAVVGANPTVTTQPTTAASVTVNGSVVVAADERTEIDVIAGVASLAGTAAVGGAVAVPVVVKTTEAFIAAGAQVQTNGQPTAINARTGRFILGSIGNAASATEVRAPSTKFTDADADGVNDLNDDGLTSQRTATPETALIRGVAVTATSRDDVETVAAGGGLSGGVTVNVGAPVASVRSTTRAFVGAGAKVNPSNGGAGAEQSVLIAAGSDVSVLTIGGTAGGATGVAVGPTAATTVLNTVTEAFVDSGAAVAAAKDVTVQADATEDAIAIAAGAAASGGVSVVGSATVLVLHSTTSALIGSGATVTAGDTVTVAADDSTDVDLVAGSLTVGVGVGVGAAVGVVFVEKDTTATVADAATVEGKATGTRPELLRRGVVVSATSKEDVTHVAAAGAGGFVGTAGAVAVTVVDSDTTARVGVSAKVNPNGGGGADQGAFVLATNAADILSVGGGLAGGAVAVGGGVDVGSLRNDTRAVVDTAATVRAAGDVTVAADETRKVRSIAVSAGGGLVGLNASVAVWGIGTKFDPSYSTETATGGVAATRSAIDDGNGSGANRNADEFAGQQAGMAGSRVTGAMDDFDSSDSILGGDVFTPIERLGQTIRLARVGLTVPTQSVVTGALNSTEAQQGTTAEVAATALVVAGDDVSVTARETMDVKQIVGGLSGGLVSAGASVGVLNLKSTTVARIRGAVEAGGDVTILADLADQTADVTAVAGSGGLVALGAAVAVVNDLSTQTAAVGSTGDVRSAASLTVRANGHARLDASTDSFNVAGVAAGAAVSRAVAAGATTASLDNNAKVGQTAGKSVGRVDVFARSFAQAFADSVAVRGGLLSGDVNFTRATATPAVTAIIRGGAAVTATGSVEVQASANTRADATTNGAVVGLVGAVGLNRATATASPVLVARIDNATVTAGADVLVVADAESAEADAEAFGGAGGVIFAGAGAKAVAVANPNVTADVRAGVEVTTAVTAGRDIVMRANADGDADANADNVVVGLLAFGAATADATTDTVGKAFIGGGGGAAVLAAGHDVTVEATSTHAARADADAAGVALAPQATATATATADFDTRAQVGSGSALRAGNRVAVRATEESANATVGDAKADGRGIGGGSEASATANVGRGGNDTALVEVQIDNLSLIEADLVQLSAVVLTATADGEADAIDTGASINGNTNAFARGDVATTVQVELLGGTVTGFSSIDIDAGHNSVINRADAFADDFLGAVGTAATTRANHFTETFVVAGAGVVLNTRSLTVDAKAVPTTVFSQAVREDGATANNVGDEFAGVNPNRRITWDATVNVLGGPNPELVIGPTGTIDKAVGVTASVGTFAGRPAVIVSPIGYAVAAEPVVFTVNSTSAFGNTVKGVVEGTAGNFIYDRSPDSVTITNASSLDVVLGGVNAVGTGTPTIRIVADSVPIGFGVDHTYDATAVTVTNSGAGDIVLTGDITNPIGTTTLTTGGNVRASGTPGLLPVIETRGLNVTAGGSIGSATTRLFANLVRSAGPASSVSVTAGQDAFLQLAGRQRQSLGFVATTSVIPLASLVAGRDLDVRLAGGLLQTTVSDTLPPSKVLETVPNPDVTTVVNTHFRPFAEEFPQVNVGVFGSGSDAVPTRFTFSNARAGRNLIATEVSADDTEIGGTLTLTGPGTIAVNGLTGNGLVLVGSGGDDTLAFSSFDGTATATGGVGTDKLAVTNFAGDVTTTDELVLATGGSAGSTGFNGGSIGGQLRIDGPTTLTVTHGKANVDLALPATLTGSGDLIKQGAGVLTVGGTSPGFTGKVVAAAGTMLLNGSLTNATAQPAGGTVGGVGTVGPVAAQTGTTSTINPGGLGAANGTLAAGNLTLNSTTTFAVNLNTTGTDLVTVGGTVALNNAPLSVTLGSGFAPALGTKFVVLSNTGRNGVTGTFAGLPEGGSIIVGTQKYTVSYVGGDGNDVTLTRVNNPSAYRERTITPADENGEVVVAGTIVEADAEDEFRLSINWGDGTVENFTFPAGSDGTPVTLRHRYRDDGSYTVDLTWTDPQGGGNRDRLTAVVANVAPTVDATQTGTVAARSPVTLTANVADAGPDDAVTVEWVVRDAAGRVVARGTGATFAFTPDRTGTFTATATATDGDGGTSTDVVEVVVPAAGATTLVAVPDADGRSVRVMDAKADAEVRRVEPFAGFTGGVRVATADLNGDGVPDVVAAAGPGGGPHVMAFDGLTGNLLASFFAYEDSFTGGVFVTAADVDGDGLAEIVTGTGEGGGPRVRTFRANGDLVSEFFAYDSGFRGGVTVAAADTNGDGQAEIVTGTGAGGGPHVRTFRANGRLVSEFFAYDAGFRGGVFVAAGDVDGDGRAEIVTGAGAGGGPHVRTFDAGGTERAGFLAGPAGFTGGVSVRVADADGDGVADIVTSTDHLAAVRPDGRGVDVADEFFGGVFVG